VSAYPTLVLIAPDKTILEQDLSINDMVTIIEGHGGVQQPCQEILKADFIIDPVTVIFGGTITFTDMSEGDPIQYDWTFEGGTPTTSSDTIVEVLYPAISGPSGYTVTLTVTDGVDVSTKIETIYVVEPSAPTPNFIADTTVITVGESVNFYNLTTNIAPGVDTVWHWTFQGGSPVEDSLNWDPTGITYNIPGEFNVYLTIGNVWGTAWHTKYHYITVLDEEPPVEICDTITNLSVMDNLIVQDIPSGGIVPGINGLGISEYAERFDNSPITYGQINGLRAWVQTSFAASPNSKVVFKVWKGANEPDSLMLSKEVAMEDMPAGQYGFVYPIYFTNPIDVSNLDQFFIGYKILPVGNDQFAVSIAADRGAGGLSTMYLNYNNMWFKSEDMAPIGNMHTSMGLEPIACDAIGVEEFAYIPDQVVIYPNPTTDVVTISFGTNFCKDCQIKVYDIMGKEVQISISEIDNSAVQLDFQENTDGIYFVSMMINGKAVTKKVLLSR
jgi:PKD repeat protein